MSNLKNCITKIIEASGDLLDATDAKRLIKRYREWNRKRAAELPLEEQYAEMGVMLDQGAQNMLSDLEMRALQDKREVLEFELKLTKAVTRVNGLKGLFKPNKKTGKYDFKKIFDVLFHGSPEFKDSISAEWHGANMMFKSVLANTLQATKLTKYWQDPKIVSEAVVYHFDPSAQVSDEAKAIAGVIAKVEKLGYLRLNQVGQYTPHSKRVLMNYKAADPGIVGKYSKEEFVNLLVTKVPMDMKYFKGLSDLEIKKKLELTYDILTGTKLDPVERLGTGSKAPVDRRHKQTGNLGKSEAVIPFANGKSWLTYLELFGSVDPQVAITQQLDTIGRTVGLRSTMGAYPKYFLESLVDKFKDDMTPEDYKFLTGQDNSPRPDAAKTVKEVGAAAVKGVGAAAKGAAGFYHDANPFHTLAFMDGTTDRVVDGASARIVNGIKAGVSIATLAKGAFIQVPDLVIKMARINKLSNDGFGGAVLGQMEELLRAKAPEERQAYLRHFGVGLDQFRHELLYDLAGGAGAQDGAMAKLLDWSYMANGMAFIDMKFKKHSASWLSTHIADLSADSRSVPGLWAELQRYGWTETDLATMSQFRTPIDGLGANMIDLDRLVGVDPELYQKYIGTVNSLMNDFTPTPMARERSVTRKGESQGSAYRNMLEIMFMFKSYPIMMMTRVLPQIMHDYRWKGRVATMLSLMTAYYFADSIKQMVDGKTPKPLNNPGNWADLMIRSGAGGLYADMIVKDYSDYGTSIGGIVLGPIGSKIDQIADITTGTVADLAEGDFKPSITPLYKLGPRYPLLDRILLNAMMEMENPGSVDDSYRELQERTGQQRAF